jgi:hypothetical protein
MVVFDPVGWDELSNFQSALTYLVLEGKQVEHAEGLYVSRDARWQGSPKYFVVHRAIGPVNRNVQHPRVIVRAGSSSTKAVSVEKIWVHGTLFVPSGLLVSRFFSFSRPGSCSCDLRGWLTAEESHQPFQVLHRCRQIELLTHEAHPA